MGGIPCGRRFSTLDELICHLWREHDVQGPVERKLLCYWVCCGKEYLRGAYRRHTSNSHFRALRSTATSLSPGWIPYVRI